MTQKTKIICIIICIVLIIITSLIYKITNYYYRKNNLLDLPIGELKYSKLSPDKKNKLNYYFINGGSISADAMRIEIETQKEKYNIYYCYSECEFDADIEWKDNNNIVVNNRTIDINGERIREN